MTQSQTDAFPLFTAIQRPGQRGGDILGGQQRRVV